MFCGSPYTGLSPPWFNLFLAVFNAIIHRIVFLNCIFGLLIFSMYKYSLRGSIIISYPETLLNSFISCKKKTQKHVCGPLWIFYL